MGIYSRSTALSAVVGMLALAAAPGLWAQQPGQNRPDSGAVQTDTSGYKGYQPSDTSKAGKSDTSGVSQGAPADTALKAKPGVQTGPSAKDSGTAGQTGMTATVDSVVCKDGSRAAKPGKTNCAKHGGVDRAATKAAWKSRGYQSMKKDTTSAGANAQPSGAAEPSKSDTGEANKQGAGGYQYNGPASDTALKAKPGVQTGPRDSSGAGGVSDSSHAGMSGMSDSSHAGMSDSSSSQSPR
jgi:hypothetical protein